ncbi:MAG: C39 family peptidase [Roseburia sp.]
MSDLRKKRRKRRRERRMRMICFIGLISMFVLVLVQNVGRTANISAFDKVELEASGCPESLIELAERNPETVAFVNDYEKYEGNPNDIDISKDVVEGEIPLFLQWDERWGYESYGDDFLAITGCGPTCLSMVYCGLTGDDDMNPYEMAKHAEAEGFYVEGSGSAWSMMEILPQEMGLDVRTVTFDEARIKAELNSGHPIICIMGPGDFTTTGHFIVLAGITDEGKIIVNDPNSKINSEKQWNIEDLMPQIRNLWSYEYNKSK